jgi:hypothetical protein
MSKHEPNKVNHLTPQQKERFISATKGACDFFPNRNYADLLEWRHKIKPSLKYSQIDCFVCREKLYYGNYYNVETNKRPIFKCKCPDRGIIFEDKCAICKTPVDWKSDKEKAVMLRCTCGHAGILPVAKEAATLSF